VARIKPLLDLKSDLALAVLRDETGDKAQTVSEYAILISLITAAVLLALALLGTQVTDQVDRVRNLIPGV
jgi:Flp pilus assembly pilin Flp